MVRKRVFNRDEIVEAALNVVARNGLDALSARRVAEELGSSTAPVYSNFKCMDALQEAVKKSAVRNLLHYTQRPVSQDPFRNIGLGVLAFARDWPRLYSALFLEPSQGYDPGPALMETLAAAMAEMPALAPLQPIERVILLKKMALFTHGLATEICTGFADDLTEAEIGVLLDETGQAMVQNAFDRPPRTEEEIALLGSFCQGQDCGRIPDGSAKGRRSDES